MLRPEACTSNVAGPRTKGPRFRFGKFYPTETLHMVVVVVVGVLTWYSTMQNNRNEMMVYSMDVNNGASRSYA